MSAIETRLEGKDDDNGSWLGNELVPLRTTYYAWNVYLTVRLIELNGTILATRASASATRWVSEDRRARAQQTINARNRDRSG